MLAICGGGMRTGSIAVYQLMREIVEVAGAGRESDGSNLEKRGREWAMEDVWVVAKQHGANPCIEPYKDRVKVVCSYRNHLDALVSLMHFKGIPVSRLRVDSRIFSNIDAYYSWKDLMPPENLMYLRYEEQVIKNRARTVDEIARFLGIELHNSQCAKIADKWSIEANKKRAKEKHKIESRDYMSERHIYRGEGGAWQEELTQEQIQSLLRVRKIARWQKEMDYQPQ